MGPPEDSSAFKCFFPNPTHTYPGLSASLDPLSHHVAAQEEERRSSREEKPEEENPQIADTEKDGLDKESDPLLEEAGSIMMDYVDLTIGSHLTAQRR